ncbi:unnamed protein product, partial [Cladocopium goreaui]
FLQNIRERHSHRKKGTRKWLFATEMDQMFGVPVATLMRTRKLENAELRAKETRNHPELPEAEEHMQFLTLVEDAEEDSHEEEFDRLFTCMDESSSSSSSSGDKKHKKRKSEKHKDRQD